MNTKIAVHLTKSLRNLDYSELKNLKSRAKKSKHLVNNFITEYSFTRSPALLSNKKIRNSYLKLKNYLINVLKFEKRLKIKSNVRLQYATNINQDLKDKYLNLVKYEGYRLNYTTNLEEIWRTIDKKSASNKPSNVIICIKIKWIVSSINLNGRSQAIYQSSKIEVNSKHRPASFYVLQNKDFFDFRLNLDIMTISEHLIGIVFRFRDEYNYYSFEFNQKSGYKRLVKVSDGRYKKIAEVRDGGLYQNDWFKIQIRIKNSNIIIRFGQDKKYEKYSTLPIVFNLDDQELRKGR